MSDIGNDLPSGWTKARIDELFAMLDDGRTLHQGWSPQCEKEPSFLEVDWAVLKTTAIQAGTFLPEYNKRLPSKLAPRPLTEVKVGDILITCAGPRIRCGIACLVRHTRRNLMMSGKMYRFRALENYVEPRYLEAFLQSTEAQEAIDRMKTGGSESGLNLTHDRFRCLEIPVAPLNEQRRIADKYEELLSDLDAGVAELKAAQKKLAQYRQSLLKAAVEGELTANWRAVQAKHGEPLETGEQLLSRILAERRLHWEEKQLFKFKEQSKTPPKDWKDKYSEPVKPDIASLPELPVGWTWATIDQLTIEQKYGSSAKTNDASSGVPVIRMGNIQDGELDLGNLKYLPIKHDEFPGLYLADGDLLFNRTNSPELVGKTAVYRSQIAPCSYASYLISVRFSPSFVPELAAAYINSVYGKRWIKSVVVQQVGQANVNGTKLSALVIPLPPLNEQKTIIQILQDQLASIFQQCTNIDISRKQTTAQRKNILRSAFSGQLVHQNPDDEPASVMLERIRTERATREKIGKRVTKKVDDINVSRKKKKTGGKQ